MSFFRPDKNGDDDRAPRDHIGALGDFWRYLQEDRPHKWASMGLALTITGLVLYFVWRSLIPPPPEPTIIYVESWPANRSQADVEREWKERAIEANARNAQRRKQFQQAADALGVQYDKPPEDLAPQDTAVQPAPAPASSPAPRAAETR